MQKDCIKCKGKNPLKYCGKTRCPILAKTEAMIKTRPKLKQNWQGSTPNIFISRGGYPNLNVGILSPPEINNTEIYDAPMQWSQQNYQISQIINLAMLICTITLALKLLSPLALLSNGINPSTSNLY